MQSDVERYANVESIVEVTSFETLCLWEKWHQQKGYTWIQDMSGPLITVGSIGTRPVCIAPLVHVVNGRNIMFVEVTSNVVDYSMIYEWLYENVPSARIDGTVLVNVVDAQNFHNVVH